MKDKTGSVVCLAAIAVMTLVFCPRGIGFQDNRQNLLKNNPPAADDGLILSPDKEHVAFVSNEDDRPSLWIMSLSDHSKKRIGNLHKEEGVANPVWSADGKRIAFETYNLNGHSPMTTNHAWVARPDGSELRRILLSAPNEHFSTYIDGWVGAVTLRIRSTLLDPARDVFFLYDYQTGKIETKN